MKKAEFLDYKKHIDALLSEAKADGLKHGATAEQIGVALPVLKRKLINHIFRGKVSPERWQEAERQFSTGGAVEVPLAPDFDVAKRFEELEKGKESKEREAISSKQRIANAFSNLTAQIKAVKQKGGESRKIRELEGRLDAEKKIREERKEEVEEDLNLLGDVVAKILEVFKEQ